MSHLAELLQAAVDETQFDLGRIRQMMTGTRTSYRSHPEDLVTPAELRDLLAHRPYGDQAMLRARGAEVIISGDTLPRLTEHLETVLQDFIDPSSGLIGHVFPIRLPGSFHTTVKTNGIQHHHCTSSPGNFAKALIRGAAVLGVERMSQLVEGWIEGEETVFHNRALLNGAEVLSQRLEPMRGVLIEPLPLSTDQLIGYLPHRPEMRPRDYLGRTILSIEYKVEPTLYQPSDRNLVKASPHTEVPGVDVPLVFSAVALESDTYADVALYWNDYLSLEACTFRRVKDAWLFEPSRFRSGRRTENVLSTTYPDNVTTLEVIDDGRLSIDSRSLRATILGLASGRSEKRRIAATRWVSSKDSSSILADRFIDLRIALEALYLGTIGGKYRGEMVFRLALCGAWHLGSDFAERKRFRKTLHDAYGRASGVVHGGRIDPTPKNRELLEDAQSLCRQGLLKLLQDDRPRDTKDWWELILGGEIPVDRA